MDNRESVRRTTIVQPFLPTVRGAVQDRLINITGKPCGLDFIDSTREQLHPDQHAAFYALDPNTQESVLAMTTKISLRFDKIVGLAIFDEASHRADLVDEVAHDTARLMDAGWNPKFASRLVLNNSPQDIIDLKDSHLRKHPIWSEGRLIKHISGNTVNPQDTLDLIVNAFTWTRQHERSLAPSNTDLHSALSVTALRAGNLAILSDKTYLPEMSSTDPDGALDLIRKTAMIKTDGRLRSSGNESLQAFLLQTIEKHRATLSTYARRDLQATNCRNFIRLLAWYADNSGYEAVNSPDFTAAITLKYIADTKAIQKLKIKKTDALLYATYHDPTYYQEVLDMSKEYGITSDNFVGSFIQRHPIDSKEQLELLRPIYEDLSQQLPDLTPGTCLLFASQCVGKDIDEAVANFRARLRNATTIFGDRISSDVINTTCVVAPNTYLERLHKYSTTK